MSSNFKKQVVFYPILVTFCNLGHSILMQGSKFERGKMNMKNAKTFAYFLNEKILTPKQTTEFKEFSKKYENKSKRYIAKEILKTKSSVSQEVIQQHVHNLDLMAQMQGFVNEEKVANIEYAKKLLLQETPYSNRRNIQPSSIETQYVSGTSLLLWFLILVMIW